MDAAVTICAKLCNTYSISPDSIVPHASVSTSGKPETGPQMPGGYSLSEFRKRVAERMRNVGVGAARLDTSGF